MSEQYLFPAHKYILIGKVIRAHGLKGDLKIIPFSYQPEHFINDSRFALIADDGRMTKPLRSQKIRDLGKQIILKLDTIDTRDEAELTIGMGVLLDRDDLSDIDAERVYPDQLEGLAVRVHSSAETIGVVESSFSNGAHDIIVVRQGRNEFLIPLVDEIVVSYDDTEIIIDPPPGLLEINADPNR
jgi:16S rRNA processing protein RimM